MRPRLFDILRCPVCKTALELDSFRTEADAVAGKDGATRVAEGILRCTTNAHEYPIIGGVPRMLPPGERRELAVRYRGFFATCGERIGSPLRDECIGKVAQDEIQAEIIERFGYEWTEFAGYGSDNFLYWIEPITPDFFPGKLGLDVGCGAGRHSEKAASFGAEMVAMDLSWAVDAAATRAQSLPSMHVVQGDVFTPPFASETFDFVYSLGVLHHTADPPRAFSSVVPLAKPGGAVFVMIYGDQRRWVIRFLRAARAITTRLPNAAIKVLSYLGGAADMVFILPYRALHHTGAERIARAIFPTRIMNYSRHSFHDIVTDWFDRLSYPEVHYYSDQQVRSWYEENRCEDILVTPLLNHAYRGLGYRGT